MTININDLNSISVEYTYALRLDGLPILYYSKVSPDPAEFPTAFAFPEGVTIHKLSRIVSVGRYRSEIKTFERYPTYSPINIELSRDLEVQEEYDPDNVLGVPLGEKSTVIARVTGFWIGGIDVQFREFLRPSDEAGLDIDDFHLIEILVDRDISTEWVGPGLIHLGQETFWAESFEGVSADPESEDPYRFRILERAVGGTQARLHRVRQVGRGPTVFTDKICVWRSRRAILYRAEVSGRRLITPWHEYAKGFLHKSPSTSKTGENLTIELVSLPALADTDLSIPATRTTLAKGVHFFEKGIADHFFVGEQILDRDQWIGRAEEARDGGEGDLEIGNATGVVDDYVAWFDPDLANPHPRAGSISYDRDRFTIPISGVFGTTFFTDNPADPPGPVRVGMSLPLANWRIPCFRRAEVLAEDEANALLLWPGNESILDEDSAFGRINASLNINSTQGEDGGWLKWRLSSEGTCHVIPRTQMRTYSYFQMHRGARFREVGGIPDYLGTNPPDQEWNSTDLESALTFPWSVEAFHPIQTRARDGSNNLIDRWEKKEITPNNGDLDVDQLAAANTFSLGTIARGFYETGERFLLVEEELDVSSGIIQIARPRIVRSDEIDIQQQFLRVHPQITPIDVPVGLGSDYDGESLYLIELSQPQFCPSFGLFTDEDDVRIAPAPVEFDTAGELLLYFYTDPEFFGLSRDIDLDTQSFLTMNSPTWVTKWGLPDSREPIKWRQMVDSILLISNSVMGEFRGNDGILRLGVRPYGSEDLTRSLLTIRDEDLVSRYPASYSGDDDLVSELIIKANFGLTNEGEYEFREIYREKNDSAVELHMESKPREIELYPALEVDFSEESFQEFFTGFLRTYRDPRRKISITVERTLGERCTPGSVVTLYLTDGRGYTPGSLDGVQALVVSQDFELEGTECNLDLIHFGVEVKPGYNLSLEVDKVISPTEIEVKEGVYVPRFSVIDGSPFRALDPVMVGDILYGEPRAAQGDRDLLTVSSVNPVTSRVTFDGPHGLSVGDRIFPPNFATAAEFYQRYAYMVAEGGELAGGVEVGKFTI